MNGSLAGDGSARWRPRSQSSRKSLILEHEGTSGFPFDYRFAIPQKGIVLGRSVKLYKVRRVRGSLWQHNSVYGNYNFDNLFLSRSVRRPASNERSGIGENSCIGSDMMETVKICALRFTEYIPSKYRGLHCVYTALTFFTQHLLRGERGKVFWGFSNNLLASIRRPF